MNKALASLKSQKEYEDWATPLLYEIGSICLPKHLLVL